jgi:hypothetical protein
LFAGAILMVEAYNILGTTRVMICLYYYSPLHSTVRGLARVIVTRHNLFDRLGMEKWVPWPEIPPHMIPVRKVSLLR